MLVNASILRSRPCLSLQQGFEAGLRKVHVSAQSLRYRTVAHDHKRDAIRETPFLIRPARKQ